MSKTSRRLHRGGTLLFTESSTKRDTTDLQKVIRRNTSKTIYSAGRHSSNSDGYKSDCIGPNVIPGRHWSSHLSTRTNQDHQRAFEEKAMKQVIELVNRKIGIDQNLTTSISTPLGGSYVRLEAEWKERLKQRNTKNKSNSKNVNYNNSINKNMNNSSNNNTSRNANKSRTQPKRLK